jgi:hypothetical protein
VLPPLARLLERIPGVPAVFLLPTAAWTADDGGAGGRSSGVGGFSRHGDEYGCHFMSMRLKG